MVPDVLPGMNTLGLRIESPRGYNPEMPGSVLEDAECIYRPGAQVRIPEGGPTFSGVKSKPNLN
jgi:hypothetical protein